MEEMEPVEKKKTSKFKYSLIIIFIIIPLLIGTILYFNNKNFKNRVNDVLGRLPGSMGENFKPSSVDLDSGDQKSYLASHYISLEPEMAADKLYIIKKDDDKLYSEIVRLMNIISTSKTEEIIKLVRIMDNRKNLLNSIYNEVKDEKTNELSDEIARLESQDLLLTINEIEKRIESDNVFKENLSNIISKMNVERATNILYYIDESVGEQILYSLNENKKTELEGSLLSKKSEQAKLIDIAGLYEIKAVDLSVEEIGNTEDFNIEELGVIYRNLSVLKSAEILAKVDDDEFIEELYSYIRKDEELMGENDSITNDISKSMQFITEYNEKIRGLVITYEKMGPEKAAKIIEKMMVNDTTVTEFEINAEPVFEISDASIVMDVLSRMKNKTLSGIMNYMSADNASILTQKLVVK